MNLNEELIVCWCAVTVSDFVALCQKMDANLSRNCNRDKDWAMDQIQ